MRCIAGGVVAHSIVTWLNPVAALAPKLDHLAHSGLMAGQLGLVIGVGGLGPGVVHPSHMWIALNS